MQTFILITVATVIFISWIISSLQRVFEQSKHSKEQCLKFKEKWGDRKIDRSQSLERRNEDIIQGFLEKITNNSRSYYIENTVRDCIREIAQAENNSVMSPNHEYLNRWSQRATPEYLFLSKVLLQRFRARFNEMESKEKEVKIQKINQELEDLKNRHSNPISQFLESAERKVRIVDDYGDENWKALDKEIDIILQKIAMKEGLRETDVQRWKKFDFYIPDKFKSLKQFLKTHFIEYHKSEKLKPSTLIDYSQFSGVDFESYLKKLLLENGFSDIRGTPITGDQGADLIAKRNGKIIIIQAKRYVGTVGNKAVQEVVAAVRFYNGDEGWVITNSQFTKSAKELAQTTGVKLIDGRDLERFSMIIAR